VALNDESEAVALHGGETESCDLSRIFK